MMASGIILAAVLAAFSPDGSDAAHNGLLKVSCVECHTRLPFPGRALSLRSEVGDVCLACHPRYHGADKMRSHPVNVHPSMCVPPDMVLDGQGRIGCVTCHAFHGQYRDEKGNKRYYLRRTPGKTLCFSCHTTLPGISGRYK
jgi:predicted CXXCH cytochrome family protein